MLRGSGDECLALHSGGGGRSGVFFRLLLLPPVGPLHRLGRSLHRGKLLLWLLRGQGAGIHSGDGGGGVAGSSDMAVGREGGSGLGGNENGVPSTGMPEED